MKRSLSVEIILDPVAWGRVKRGKYGQAYVPAKTAKFEKQVALLVRHVKPLPLFKGPLILTAKFILKPPVKWKRDRPCVRPDLDNYLKALKDGLVGVLYEDDSQVCEYGAGTGKFYDMQGGPPRILLTLAEIE